MTRLKARRREQGTGINLCPLPVEPGLIGTEGALKKEAQFCQFNVQGSKRNPPVQPLIRDRLMG